MGFQTLHHPPESMPEIEAFLLKPSAPIKQNAFSLSEPEPELPGTAMMDLDFDVSSGRPADLV